MTAPTLLRFAIVHSADRRQFECWATGPSSAVELLFARHPDATLPILIADQPPQEQSPNDDQAQTGREAPYCGC